MFHLPVSSTDNLSFSSPKSSLVHVMIANIPAYYRSATLRNYFSQFIESDGFDCFHFRHRPEVVRIQPVDCSALQPVSETSSNKSMKIDFEQNGGVVDKKKNKSGTFCCIVRLKEERVNELIRMYCGKRWLDEKGEPTAAVCRLSRIKVLDLKDNMPSLKFQTRAETRQIPSERETFTTADLVKLIELNPPSLMPNGNVGTPTRTFLEFIQQCQLPPSIISKLGLVFPKTRSNRRYGNVSLDYKTSFGEDRKCSNVDTGNQNNGSRRGKLICRRQKNNGIRQEKKSRKKEEDNSEKDESDSDDCEEWDRYSALHDDPTNQERNTERLFEEEMEVVWEKGGSGLVWYTDAQFWDQQAGDEEEKDTDDWDLDFGPYYDSTTGDKDSRDFVQMKRDERRRKGRDCADEEMYNSKIGQFEKYSKGIGRKLMTRQGWAEGQGLGSKVQGIADALNGDGQKPWDKKGFGYRGESKLVHLNPMSTSSSQPPPKRSRVIDRDHPVIISTIYDDPKMTDPEEGLLRTREHYHLKYRPSCGLGLTPAIKFFKSNETLNPPLL